MQLEAEWVWMAKRWVGTDVWFGWLATILHLVKHVSCTTAIATTKGHCLSTGDSCSQTGHNDGSTRTGSYSKRFVSFNGVEVEELYVCKSSHHFVFYSNTRKRKLADILKVDAVILLPFPALISIGYVQHTGVKYFCYRNLPYHVQHLSSEILVHESLIWKYRRRLGIADDNN